MRLPPSTIKQLQYANKIRAYVDAHETLGICHAAVFVLNNLSTTAPCKIRMNKPLAEKIIRDYVVALLNGDQFEAAATILWGADGYNWQPRSARDTWRCLFKSDKLLIQGAGAMGKCQAKGTPIIMADGSIKPVEDVRLGDHVMGPDSTPRTVMQLHSGRSQMYRVEQERGDAYTVTDDHILTLICTADKLNGDQKTISNTYKMGKMIDMPIKEYLSKSDQFKEFYKGAYTGIEFPQKEIPIDPYVFGLWIGDGSVKGRAFGITTPDEIIRDTWVNYWQSFGHKIRIATKENNKASGYFIRNGSIQDHIGFAIDKDGEKIVPDAFKINIREIRMQVLAGFLDTDGYVTGPGFEFSQKNKNVTDAIVFIARSLGLTATVCKTRKQCVNNGVWGEYYICKIGGDCMQIPTKLKRALPRKQRVCIGRKLTITPAGEQEYYGFALDKDRRYLLGDFTITHNSYSAGAWFYLDWFRDPAHTAIKIVSLTKEHAERNIFASIKTFHRTALVRPLMAVDADMATSIQATKDNKQGIHLVAIPKGESGHGTLRGFHPSPRLGALPHPRWGKLSRTHVVLDEAEEIPAGVWEGINNILSSADSEHKGRIKVFGASNPKDRTSEFGQRCEPERGWSTIDCEKDFEWKSKQGFHVLRLDAANCENVIEKKIVFHGLQTYEGFMSYVSRGKTAESMTMARGWFPDEGVSMGIISPAMMDNAIGQTRFIGPVVGAIAFDLALEGVDQVVCSMGRHGLSSGWTAQDGIYRDYDGGPRVVLQLDSQIPFPKKPTIEQAQAIIDFCKQMHVTSNWVIVDRTGNGAGIHDALCSMWSKDVMGVNYSWAATDTPIMGDDSQKASELYSGVVTELLFGLAKYLEFGYLKISPGYRVEELTRQATGRKYVQRGQGLVRVESKKDYCRRTRQKSPDELDSLSLLVFLLRQRSGSIATMLAPKPEPINNKEHVGRSIESMEFVDFSD